jgi:hypothetical protein
VSEENRGAIKYIDRYKQLISYEGLQRHRRITPTDIDGMIDYNGNAFIILEGKLENKTMDYGQKLAIEHLINSLEKAGKRAFCILFRHDKPPNEIIPAAECRVDWIYGNNKGKTPCWYQLTDKTVTVKRMVESIEQRLIFEKVSI